MRFYYKKEDLRNIKSIEKIDEKKQRFTLDCGHSQIVLNQQRRKDGMCMCKICSYEREKKEFLERKSIESEEENLRKKKLEEEKENAPWRITPSKDSLLYPALQNHVNKLALSHIISGEDKIQEIYDFLYRIRKFYLHVSVDLWLFQELDDRLEKNIMSGFDESSLICIRKSKA